MWQLLGVRKMKKGEKVGESLARRHLAMSLAEE
jgi:hypothetical protein